MNDFRYALRTLRKTPGFTISAVLTLALGIGATTAMFSVVRGVLLDPLPYERPGELVALWTRYLPSSGEDIPQFPLSPPEMIEYRDQSRLMRDVVPYGVLDRTLGGDGEAPRRVRTGFLGAGMFDLLGVQAAAGRTFAPEEELPGAGPVLVLGHRLWLERFGGDPAVVGRTVTFNGLPAQVAGVMPERFVFPDASVDLWAPFGLDEAAATNRFAHYLMAVGRLAPGATLEGAQWELETITAAWSAEHEHHAMGHFIFLRGFRDDVVGDRGPLLWLLMAAVALVLIIAGVNVANLLLARTESRHAEVAVRAALGATRSRLARQFLTESLVLAGAGALIGVLFAAWAMPALLAVNPDALPRGEAVRLDGLVLGFALLTAVGTALLFGLAPALRASASAGSLPARRATGGPAHTRLHGILIGGQAALGVAVILAGGLVARSFVELTRVDAGVHSQGVLLFDLQLPASDYPAAAVPATYGQLLERLHGLPGVRRAGATSSLPVADVPTRQDITIDGVPDPPPGVAHHSADIVAVHPGYFEALGIPVLEGRPLDPGDRDGARLVALVNEAAADRYWPDGAVGGRFRYTGERPWIAIVGVVGDTKVEGLREDDRPQVYLPHPQLRAAQGSIGRGATIVVRTDPEPMALAAPVRAVVRELDAGLPVANLRTMDGVLARAVAPERFTASLMGGFALLVLLLAAIGVYGVVAYAMVRRTREIGIRMALGARAGDVLTTMMGVAVRPVAIGLILGLAATLAGAGLLSRFVYNVSARDPVTFLAAPLLLLAVAAAATYLPARRAARIHPMEALRHE
jgi:putative ABC transport system permease protein